MKQRKNKLVCLLFATVMTVGLLTGCGNDGKTTDSNGSAAPQTALEVVTALKDTKLEGEIDTSQTTLTTLLEYTPEPAGHGHPYVEGGPNWSLQPLIYDTLCDYSSLPETTFKPQALESYEVDGNVLTLKLKDGLKYSDGSPINADELLTNLYMDLSNRQLLVYAEDIEKIDDLTVQITYVKTSQTILMYLLNSKLMFSTAEYDKWAQEYKEVFENMRELNEEGEYEMTDEGQERFDEITLDCNTYLPKMTEIKTSGAFYISSVSSDEIILTANPNYHQTLYITTIKGIRQSTTESFQIAVQNHELDVEAGGLSTELALTIAQENADTIRQVAVPAFTPWGFCLNVNKAPTDKLEVRQAIAYVIDTESIAPATEPGMLAADQYCTGLSLSLRDAYLTEEDLSELTAYDYNLDKATELLESIGWTKSGNQWHDENGNVPELVIAGIGAYQVELIMGEAAAAALTDFGFNASFVSKEATAYADYAQSGDAQIVIDAFGNASSTQTVYQAYSGIWWYGTRMNLTFPESGEKLVWKDEVTGEDFHYEDAVNGLKMADTNEEMAAYVKQIAAFHNHNVWYIPVTDQCTVYRIHNDKLSMPSVATTGEQANDFYWTGDSSVILSKLIHSEELYFVK